MKQYKRCPFEFKELSDRQFEGYGSIFGNVDYGGDIVLPGAFTKTLKDHALNGILPQMYWMHRPDKVPGKWLQMNEDSKGLYVKGEFAPTPLGDEIRTLAGMKAVRGLSIGYETVDRAYDKEGNRLLKELNLWEVSPVSLAMNPMANITMSKSRLSKDGEYVPEEAELKRDVERFLRDAGCSRTIAMTLVAKMLDGTAGVIPDDHQSDSDIDGLSDEEKAAYRSILGKSNDVAGSLFANALKSFK